MHSERYGLSIPHADARWEDVQAYVQDVTRRIRGGTSSQASADVAKEGVEVIHGEASFTSPHALTVNDRTISAERIVIAAGCQTVVPPVEGLDKVGFITNSEAIALPALPRRLAIVGGGAIGMEFAQMFHRFGVEVTVLEHSPQLLDKEDREMSDTLCKLLTKEGLRLETDVELLRVRRDPKGKYLTI